MNNRLTPSFFITGCILLLSASAGAYNGNNRISKVFIENNGQIADQYFNPRNDIDFVLQDGGISVFVGKGQLHYQFIKHEIPQLDIAALKNKDLELLPESAARQMTGKVQTYRMDVQLVGANPNATIVREGRQAYREHYYLPQCKDGAGASVYEKVTYKNVYPDIDWVIYVRDGHMEQDFVVGAAGDARQIQIAYNGHTGITLNKDGSLTTQTPMGTVTEHAPVCYAASGKAVAGSYHLQGNVLTYDVAHQAGIKIDPEIIWGTYFGPDTSSSPMYSIVCDEKANVYSCGLTYSAQDGSIATTGAFQVAYGGNSDAFVVKFDSSGHRLWATYYGGDQGDWGNGIAYDKAGNVYLAGTTQSTSGIATAGALQTVYGGGLWDAFVVRFDTNGVRNWATYLGGSGSNIPSSISCDDFGHIYLCGDSNDPNNISTPDGFQPVKAGGFDAYLVQFDSTGARVWGTYYGGSGNEFGAVHDNYNGSVYIAGYTPSTSGIATPGTFQTAYGGGGNDAYVVRFSGDGARVWGTYYGGSASENLGGISARLGLIYVLGATGSDDVIASAGCYQPTRNGGITDAFLVCLDPEMGARMWGTYYGGEGTETVDLSRLTVDDSGCVYITGYTTSLTGIASDSALQHAYGGGDQDAFWAKFNPAGKLKWSTYLGGTGLEEGRQTAFDGSAVYLCGKTNSTTHIATPNGFIPTGGGDPYYYQGFVVKYGIPDTTANTPIDTDSVASVHNYAVEMDVRMFPVPNHGAFVLQGTVKTDNGTANIQVVDMAGRVVLQTIATVSNGHLNKAVNMGDALVPGVYLVKIITPNGVKVLRCVRE